MLPAPFTQRPSLADVFPSLFAAIRGEPNRLGLPQAGSAILLLVDGLGAHMLSASAGHARTLSKARGDRLVSGFPTTTASALATLTTGTHPGAHGIVGYTALEPRSRRVINQLSGWGADLVPDDWQREPTWFERAKASGIPALAVGAARYEDSGFTRAVLRGANYVVARGVLDRLELARAHLGTVGGGLAYVYVPELDQVAHRRGWQSPQWLAALEELDAAVRTFTAVAPRGEGILVTADHGMVDVPGHRQVYYDSRPALLDGVDSVAGEPRCLQLHFEPGLSEAERISIVARWSEAEGHRAWVATREQAVQAGWFGPQVHPEVMPRLADLFVAARKGIAYYDSRSASASALAMVGQHGSLTDDETGVPLLRMGSFAR